MADNIITMSPVTGRPLFQTQGVTVAEAKEIVAASKNSFLTWKKVPLSTRLGIVKKAMELVHENREELAEDLTIQMGRPIRFTGNELDTMKTRAEYLMSIAEEKLSDTPGISEPGFKRRISKEPLGPVLIIFAWNVSVVIHVANGEILLNYCSTRISLLSTLLFLLCLLVIP